LVDQRKAGRPVFGGQALLTALNVDPHLVAALLDSSLRSPYTTPLLATPSSAGLISQQPLVSFSSKEAPVNVRGVTQLRQVILELRLESLMQLVTVDD